MKRESASGICALINICSLVEPSTCASAPDPCASSHVQAPTSKRSFACSSAQLFIEECGRRGPTFQLSGFWLAERNRDVEDMKIAEKLPEAKGCQGFRQASCVD